MMKSTLHFALLVSAIAGVNSESQCGGNPCPSGEDCIKVGGSFRCADPCVHYRTLNDSWRATNIETGNVTHCDRDLNWKGWYRLFLQDTGVAMPESCVEKHRCGAHAPLWLAESHPRLEDGVAQRNVCGTWSSDCCYFKSHPIHVKACHGNFYVYKFVIPSTCHLAYCADVSSKICASCGHNDICVRSDNASWTCEMQEVLRCGRRIIELGLLVAYLENKGLNASSGHLADRQCSAHQQRNSTVWYMVERMAGRCGNTLTTNGTHAIYSNSLFVYPKNIPEDNSLPGPVSFPFSCVYPLDTETSLDLAIRLRLQTRNAVFGYGSQAQASMSLFRNSNFTGPYPAGPVTLPIGATLYVGIMVDETETNRFVVVLEDCYIAHTPNRNDRMRDFLIHNRCPTDRRQVSVAESGSSLQARFSALLFLSQSEVRDVFLHCSLSLCDHNRTSCSPVCRRRRRSSPFNGLYLELLTIGPISWQ